MALAGKLEKVIEIKAPAEKFYEVFSCKPHHLPNVSPEKIQGVQMHEGNWGAAGSVINWNYVLDGKEHTAKEIVEVIDDENKLVAFKVIGGEIMNDYKSFKFTVQSVPKGKGSLIKLTMEYEKLSADIPPPDKLMEFAIHLTKDIEKHLVQDASKGKLEKVVETKGPVEKFHEIFGCKPHSMSNICPEKIQGVQMHDGDWGAAGSVTNWNYVLDGKQLTLKAILELNDDENKLVNYKVIGGDIMKDYKSFRIIAQCVPKGEGSLIKWTMEYEKLSADIPPPDKLMEFCTHATRDFEEHFILNASKGKLEEELETKAPAEKIFEFVGCKQHHISNISPNNIQGAHLHEGDWGTSGCVINWTYVIDGKAQKAKDLVEVFDEKNKIVTYKVIEGDLLNEYKSFRITIQTIPKASGSLVKITIEYEKLSDDVAVPKKIMDCLIGIIKDIEQHLTSA